MWQSPINSCKGRHGPSHQGFHREWSMTRIRRAKGWRSIVVAIGSVLFSQLKTYRRLACALGASLGLLAWASSAPAAQIYAIDVPAGLVRESLLSLSAQTSLTITLAPNVSDGPYTPAVSGSLTAAAALSQMLTDTGLAFAFVAPGEVEVRPALGEVRWYEIEAAPALEGLHNFINTLGWDASVDRNAAMRTQTSTVHGCLNPDNAARALFTGTPLTYEWMIDSRPTPGPQTRALVVRAASTSRWRSMIRRPRKVVVVPELSGTQWQCFGVCAKEGERKPPQTCVHLPDIQ